MLFRSILTPLAATGGPTAAALDAHVYDLDGDTDLDTPGGSTVVDINIEGVTLDDAKALDRLIDGAAATMSWQATDTGNSNTEGRVIWNTGTTTGTYDINVYLTHR